ARRAPSAKSGQRLPDGEEDILREVVALRAGRRVDGDHPPERGPVLPQDFVERHARYSLARGADLTRFAERPAAVCAWNLSVDTFGARVGAISGAQRAGLLDNASSRRGWRRPRLG